MRSLPTLPALSVLKRSMKVDAGVVANAIREK